MVNIDLGLGYNCFPLVAIAMVVVVALRRSVFDDLSGSGIIISSPVVGSAFPVDGRRGNDAVQLGIFQTANLRQFVSPVGQHRLFVIIDNYPSLNGRWTTGIGTADNDTDGNHNHNE